MTPYAFFLDIDNTILYKPTPDHPGIITDRVKEAFRKARAAGHYVFINTGRAPSYFYGDIPTLPVDGYVAGCGTYIIFRGEVIFRAEYPVEALERWIQRLSEPGDPGIVAEGEKRIFRYRNSYWVPEDDWILGETIEDFREYLKADHLVKASVCNDIDPALLPELERDFEVCHHPTEHYTECGTKGYSKATGMEMVLARLGLDKSRAVAVGDSENDLEMLKAAGIAVVMGQAREEIKQYADIICDTVQNDGAAKIIEELIKK